LVIAILVMLFIITLAFFVLSQVERSAAIRNLDSLRAQYIAEAGVAYARKILELDKQANLIDSLQDLTFQNFQGTDVDLDGDGKNESRVFQVTDIQGNPFGRFSVKISDEASRLHLNNSSAEVLSRLFSRIGIDSSKLSALLSRRPFNAKEETGPLLGTRDFGAARDYLTVYSRDLEIDLDRKRRVYLNTSSARVILEAFLDAGISEPYQKAANLKDASDADLAQTLLDEFSRISPPAELLEPGAWRNKGNFYEALPGDENPGKFSWSNLPLADGQYLCFLYGPQMADMVSAEPLLFSGGKWPETVKVEGGGFTLSLKPAKDRTCRFSYIKLVSMDSKNGLNRRVIAGTEALVINELMVKPSREILADTPAYIESGQSRQWSFSQIKPGYYYAALEALEQGGLVADVSINGRVAEKLRDQDYFPESINVGENGNIMVKIQNNSLERAGFKGIKILQEPDGEFIELLNLSPAQINLDNFSVEVYTNTGEPIAGWPARIPANTVIEPYQHLVLAIDGNDAAPAPANLQANGISFSNIYKVNAVGLIFDGDKNINKNSDLLPDSGGRVILKNSSGERIDGVEYNSAQVKDFVSLERGDPSVNDQNSNGFFDGWYLSGGKDGATAGMANENAGMYTMDEKTGNLIKNNVSQIKVFNRPLSNLGEVLELSSGKSWKKFSLQDIALMADHFAYEAIDLEMQNYEKGFASDNTGIWEFPNIAAGSYLLDILSSDINLAGNEIQIGIKTDPAQDFKDFKPVLFNQGIAFYGTVQMPQAVSSSLWLKISSGAKEILTGLKKVRLEPIFSTLGRVNINTAQPQVLFSLFNSEDLAQIVLKNRPIGTNNGGKLGVGELFLLNEGFLPFYNYLTVKSDVYEINCRGEYYPQDKTLSYQTIRTVVERGN